MKVKSKKRLPRGRPDGIPQPTGPERIRRKEPVVWDSLYKRAIAGEPEAVRLCVDLKLIDPEMGKKVINGQHSQSST